jgi:hypothetical protein
MDDRDIQALHEGRIPADDAELGGVARFASDLDVVCPEVETAGVRAAHLAAMASAHLEATEPARRPTSRRRDMLKTLLATRAAKITAAAVAMLLALSGVAVAGVLPHPVQDVVANTVAPVGIDLPGGSNEAAEQAAEAAAEAADAAKEAAEEASATVENDQGEDADDQGDATDEAVQAPETDESASESAADAQDAAAEAAHDAAPDSESDSPDSADSND